MWAMYRPVQRRAENSHSPSVKHRIITAVLFLRPPLGLALGRLAVLLALLAPLALAVVLPAVPADEARAHDAPNRQHYLHEEIYKAAGEDGNLAAVIHLLDEHGVSPNAIHEPTCPAGCGTVAPRRFHYRPIHSAAEHGRVTIVATLIAAGADVNASISFSEGGNTALHLAAGGFRVGTANGPSVDSSAAIVSLLLDAGADVNAKDRYGRTPLRDTCYSDPGYCPARYSMNRAILIAAGGHWGEFCAAGFFVNPAGPTIPCVCPAGQQEVSAGNCAIPGESVCAGLNPPEFFDAVLVSITAGECVSFRPCAGGTLGRETNTCECPAPAVLDGAGNNCECPAPNLEFAAGDYCRAPSAKSCGGLTPPQFYSPTLSACAPYSECVDAGDCELSASVCQQGFTPGRFYDAAAGECGDPLHPCHDSAVRKADNSGCECPTGTFAHGDPSGGFRHDSYWANRNNYAPHDSSRNEYGPYEYIPNTAECHSAPDGHHAPLAHDLDGWSAAIRMNAPEVVSHFIDDHEQDPDSGLALHLAAEHDSHLAALALIEGGADVNRGYSDNSGFRGAPLHYAARHGSFRTAKVLLGRGADPDLWEDLDDDTPLHLAARLPDAPENVALVSLLLDKGADPNIRNDDRLRPLDLAYGRTDSFPPRRKMMAALITGGADWASECTGGTIPNENYRGEAQVATYPECKCPPHLSERGGGGECVCPAHSHSQVNELCLPKDSPQVELEIDKMRAELESLRMALAALNVQLSLAADGPPEMLEEVAKQAEVAARGIAQRRNNFLALARAGLAEADDAGPAPSLALSDTEATCRMLEGEVQTHSRTGAKICSGIDHNDTFCIVGSASAFPCVGLFRHVRRCNDDHNRPALDPWHCAQQCADGLRAHGARCEPES